VYYFEQIIIAKFLAWTLDFLLVLDVVCIRELAAVTTIIVGGPYICSDISSAYYDNYRRSIYLF